MGFARPDADLSDAAPAAAGVAPAMPHAAAVASPAAAERDGSPPQTAGARPDPAAPAAAAGAPRWAVVGIFLLLLVGGLAFARAFLTPIILAFLLALVFSPVRRLLERSRIPAGLAAAIIVLGLVGALLAIGFLLSGPVSGWIEDAPRIGERLETRVREIRASLGGDEDAPSMEEVVKEVEAAAGAGAAGDAQEVVIQERSALGQLASGAPDALVQTAMVLVLLLFILASGDMFYEKIVHVMPTFRDKRRAMRIARDVERKLSRYLFTITVINGGLGAAIALAMWALDMPNPLLIGMLAWLLNYIPYVGALGGVAVTLAAGLLTFDTTGAALVPAGAYFLLTTIEGQFVTPYFVGRNLRLNTVVVFIAVAFWAWLWSVVGMLVAVPLLVTVRTFCENVPQLEPLGDFLSARGAEVEDDPDAAQPDPAGSPAAPA